MPEKTFNVNIEKIESIPTPLALKEEIKITDKIADHILDSRRQIEEIINGNDKRLLAIVGPCSIHDTDLALDYAKKLNELRKSVEKEILVVMRVYFEKPRTILGWKGLISDPHLDDSFDTTTGIKKARKLLLDINEMGLACATELLDPVIPQYISDLISWAAIGARTTESQTHRQMASGLSMPVGFKNGTNGDLAIAINAVEASFSPQSFIGINQEKGQVSIFHTKGNPYAHLVLRGGSSGPNYSSEHVEAAEKKLKKAGIETGILIDCNHANSGKDPFKQPAVLEDILSQKANGNKSIIGFMVESNIEAGNQPIPKDLSELKYGVSITDKCIDWAATEKMLQDAAEKLR